MDAQEGPQRISGYDIARGPGLQKTHVPQNIDQIIRVTVRKPGRGIASGKPPCGQFQAEKLQVLAVEGRTSPAKNLENAQKAWVLKTIFGSYVTCAFLRVAPLGPADCGVW